MAACEKCWEEASGIAALRGTTTTDEYYRILKEGRDCTMEEMCGDLHIIPVGKKCCRCGRETIEHS